MRLHYTTSQGESAGPVSYREECSQPKLYWCLRRTSSPIDGAQLRRGACFTAKGNGELFNLLLPNCCGGRRIFCQRCESWWKATSLGTVVCAGQYGQSSRRSTQEMLLSSCTQQHYSQLVPVEVREEANLVFKVLCFSECCEGKEVVLWLLATHTYYRNKKMQTSNLRLFSSAQRSAYRTQTI